MTHALQKNISWNDIVCGGTPYGDQFRDVWGERWGMGKHSTAAEVRSLIGHDRWSSYFTFSIVRNPADRIRSMYTWTAKIVNRHGLDGWRRWARHISDRWKRDIRQWPTVRAYLDTSDFSEYIRHPALEEELDQSDFITSESGDDLIVDSIYKLENIEENIEVISKKVGVKLRLPKNNASSEGGEIGISNNDIKK